MSAPVPEFFDCNVHLQAMLNTRGAVHACWQSALGGRVTLYVTPHILGEIRKLPEHRSLRRFRNFTAERVEGFIEELLDVATLAQSPPEDFTYPRDPDDAHYLNLAIATGALLVVSNGRDLLDLMNDDNPTGVSLRARHPAFRVVTPPQLL